MFVNWILRLSWEIYIYVINTHGDEWDTREKWILLTARDFLIFLYSNRFEMEGF